MNKLAPLICCALLLAACQQTAEEPQVIPPQPAVIDTEVEQPANEAPPSNEATTPVEPANEIRDSMFATRYDGSKAITADDVLCDLTERKLTFRFRNLETRSWQLNYDLSLTPPEGLVGVYLMINNYQVNDRSPHYLDGERLFGPSEIFSDNCGGVEILNPGEQAVCTLQPVPLSNIYEAGGVNEIIINVPGVEEDPRVEFICE